MRLIKWLYLASCTCALSIADAESLEETSSKAPPRLPFLIPQAKEVAFANSLEESSSTPTDRKTPPDLPFLVPQTKELGFVDNQEEASLDSMRKSPPDLPFLPPQTSSFESNRQVLHAETAEKTPPQLPFTVPPPRESRSGSKTPDLHSKKHRSHRGKHNTFFLDGEFLYWRPDQAGMTYCLTTNDISFFLGSKNKEVHQESSWGPGFRVGAGYQFAKASCDLSTYWTRFHHSMHSSVSGPFIFGTQLLSPLGNLSIGGKGSDLGKARSKWRLNVDLVELDFGYRLLFKQRLLLHPYLAIEGGWIDQLQTIKYNHFLNEASDTIFNSTVKQKNDFSGVGPKLGMNGDFALGCGFGIMGNIAASFLYGFASNPVRVSVKGDPQGFPVSPMVVKYSQHRLIPIVQAQIGLDWKHKCFKNGSITLSIAYESQYFWGTWRNQDSLIQNVYISDGGYGNLMLQGGTGQLKLAF